MKFDFLLQECIKKTIIRVYVGMINIIMFVCYKKKDFDPYRKRLNHRNCTYLNQDVSGLEFVHLPIIHVRTYVFHVPVRRRNSIAGVRTEK